MRSFEFYAPTKYEFGAGAIERIGADLASEGLERALLVYGRGSAVKSGLLAQVKDAVEAAGLEVTELAGVRPNPEVGLVR